MLRIIDKVHTLARMFCLACVSLFLVVMSEHAISHDPRPVVVNIDEIPGNQFAVKWKIPVSVPVYALPQLTMPNHCEARGQTIHRTVGEAHTFEANYTCEQALAGNQIGIDFVKNNPGLATLFQIQLLSGEKHTHILPADERQWRVPEREDLYQIAKAYTLFGIEHIFSGYDHLLFVACLIIIAGNLRRIIITISGFTLAHSLTLAVATLGMVKLPTPPVEAAIALSIAFLAHEIVVANKSSWTWRYPLLVSTAFGFIHGFGFASVLQGIGLPQLEISGALLFFNVGVEIGQILFIAIVVGILRLANKIKPYAGPGLIDNRLTTTFASYVIGVTATYWLVERITDF